MAAAARATSQLATPLDRECSLFIMVDLNWRSVVALGEGATLRRLPGRCSRKLLPGSSSPQAILRTDGLSRLVQHEPNLWMTSRPGGERPCSGVPGADAFSMFLPSVSCRLGHRPFFCGSRWAACGTNLQMTMKRSACRQAARRNAPNASRRQIVCRLEYELSESLAMRIHISGARVSTTTTWSTRMCPQVPRSPSTISTRRSCPVWADRS